MQLQLQQQHSRCRLMLPSSAAQCRVQHQPQPPRLRRPLQQHQHHRHRSRHQPLRVAAAKEDPPPSREDRANPNKADFSAYWSLKFREFFSKRRGYLQLSRKQAEAPAIFRKLDEAIAVQEERIEAARMQAR